MRLRLRARVGGALDTFLRRRLTRFDWSQLYEELEELEEVLEDDELDLHFFFFFERSLRRGLRESRVLRRGLLRSRFRERERGRSFPTSTSGTGRGEGAEAGRRCAFASRCGGGGPSPVPGGDTFDGPVDPPRPRVLFLELATSKTFLTS